MTPFSYARASDTADAIKLLGTASNAKFLAGGTNLVDLMRETIERPAALVDIKAVSRNIEERADGGLLIGAGVTNSELAAHRTVRTNYPMLTRAILAGASAQIRNMATVGGNILQRTRCAYFYDDAARCNKREPGTGCDAIDGFNRMHAILGASPSCVATHPSDMCVALAASDAIIHVQGRNGTRTIPLIDFHTLPGGHPDLETQLVSDELITAVELPSLPLAQTSTYRKVRDRSSYAFALVSVAAGIAIKDGKVSDVRLALGGVAHKPWRAWTAEKMLRGQAATEANFRAAAEAELEPAAPLRDNAFKVELAKRVISATLAGLTRNEA